jgi:hypothetical protein
MRKQLSRELSFAVVLIAMAVLSTNLSATALPITDSGVLTISNLPGTLLAITVTPSECLNWGGATTCVAGTQHQFSVSGVSNLFSTAASATDLIKDLPAGPTVVDFEQVMGSGALGGQTIFFDLTSLPINSGTTGNCASNAANNTCSPAGSPFTIAENSLGNGITISFSVDMKAYTGASASGSTSYTGLFSTQQAVTLVGAGSCSGLAANITNFLICEAAAGTVSGTWSATEAPVAVTAVPEPLSFALLGSGLAALGLLRRPIRRP